jgi:hypothetical protein
MPLTLDGNTGVQDNSGAFVAGTAVASTSGTSIDFTSIPSWVKRITVMFDGVSTNGSSNLLIQIGDSGGIETSGYISGAINQIALSTSTAGFIATHNNSAGAVQGGVITLSLLNSSTYSWASAGNVYDSSVGAQVSCGAGTKSLSATLDRVRITTVNGTDAFDAGSINILYE